MPRQAKLPNTFASAEDACDVVRETALAARLSAHLSDARLHAKMARAHAEAMRYVREHHAAYASIARYHGDAGEPRREAPSDPFHRSQMVFESAQVIGDAAMRLCGRFRRDHPLHRRIRIAEDALRRVADTLPLAVGADMGGISTTGVLTSGIVLRSRGPVVYGNLFEYDVLDRRRGVVTVRLEVKQ